MTLVDLMLGSSKWLLISICTAVIAVFLALGTSYTLIYTYSDGTANLPADCAIVFGAAVYGRDSASPALTRRSAAAAELYRTHMVSRIILSGGKGSAGRSSEAEVMKNLMVEQGVPLSALTLEDQSHSTWENIQNTKNLTSDCSSVIAVSDQYHLARIEFLSWRQGWGELQTSPAQERMPVGNERRGLIREIFALIYYGVFGDIILPNAPKWFF